MLPLSTMLIITSVVAILLLLYYLIKVNLNFKSIFKVGDIVEFIIDDDYFTGKIIKINLCNVKVRAFSNKKIYKLKFFNVYKF